VTELTPCDRCKRPAKVRALYFRANGLAVLAGRFGGACFYTMAGQIAESGLQPEHETAKPVWLRRGTR
jgi:hypothetical protein